MFAQAYALKSKIFTYATIKIMHAFIGPELKEARLKSIKTIHHFPLLIRSLKFFPIVAVQKSITLLFLLSRAIT